MRFSVAVVLAAIAFVTVSAKISCYQCVSVTEENCSSSDTEELSEFKKECPDLETGELAGKSAIGCRKVLQNVEEESSVIRECAYTGTPVDGLKKTGNWAISKYYYQCVNEQEDEPCNFASSLLPSLAMLLSVLALHF